MKLFGEIIKAYWKEHAIRQVKVQKSKLLIFDEYLNKYVGADELLIPGEKENLKAAVSPKKPKDAFVFDLLLKKFVNPNLDLLSTGLRNLEQLSQCDSLPKYMNFGSSNINFFWTKKKFGKKKQLCPLPVVHNAKVTEVDDNSVAQKGWAGQVTRFPISDPRPENGKPNDISEPPGKDPKKKKPKKKKQKERLLVCGGKIEDSKKDLKDIVKLPETKKKSSEALEEKRVIEESLVCSKHQQERPQQKISSQKSKESDNKIQETTLEDPKKEFPCDGTKKELTKKDSQSFFKRMCCKIFLNKSNQQNESEDQSILQETTHAVKPECDSKNKPSSERKIDNQNLAEHKKLTKYDYDASTCKNHNQSDSTYNKSFSATDLYLCKKQAHTKLEPSGENKTSIKLVCQANDLKTKIKQLLQAEQQSQAGKLAGSLIEDKPSIKPVHKTDNLETKSESCLVKEQQFQADKSRESSMDNKTSTKSVCTSDSLDPKCKQLIKIEQTQKDKIQEFSNENKTCIKLVCLSKVSDNKTIQLLKHKQQNVTKGIAKEIDKGQCNKLNYISSSNENKTELKNVPSDSKKASDCSKSKRELSLRNDYLKQECKPVLATRPNSSYHESSKPFPVASFKDMENKKLKRENSTCIASGFGKLENQKTSKVEKVSLLNNRESKENIVKSKIGKHLNESHESEISSTCDLNKKDAGKKKLEPGNSLKEVQSCSKIVGNTFINYDKPKKKTVTTYKTPAAIDKSLKKYKTCDNREGLKKSTQSKMNAGLNTKKKNSVPCQKMDPKISEKLECITQENSLKDSNLSSCGSYLGFKVNNLEGCERKETAQKELKKKTSKKSVTESQCSKKNTRKTILSKTKSCKKFTSPINISKDTKKKILKTNKQGSILNSENIEFCSEVKMEKSSNKVRQLKGSEKEGNSQQSEDKCKNIITNQNNDKNKQQYSYLPKMKNGKKSNENSKTKLDKLGGCAILDAKETPPKIEVCENSDKPKRVKRRDEKYKCPTVQEKSKKAGCSENTKITERKSKKTDEFSSQFCTAKDSLQSDVTVLEKVKISNKKCTTTKQSSQTKLKSQNGLAKEMSKENEKDDSTTSKQKPWKKSLSGSRNRSKSNSLCSVEKSTTKIDKSKSLVVLGALNNKQQLESRKLSNGKAQIGVKKESKCQQQNVNKRESISRSLKSEAGGHAKICSKPPKNLKVRQNTAASRTKLTSNKLENKISIKYSQNPKICEKPKSANKINVETSIPTVNKNKSRSICSLHSLQKVKIDSSLISSYKTLEEKSSYNHVDNFSELKSKHPVFLQSSIRNTSSKTKLKPSIYYNWNKEVKNNDNLQSQLKAENSSICQDQYTLLDIKNIVKLKKIKNKLGTSTASLKTNRVSFTNTFIDKAEERDTKNTNNIKRNDFLREPNKEVKESDVSKIEKGNKNKSQSDQIDKNSCRRVKSTDFTTTQLQSNKVLKIEKLKFISTSNTSDVKQESQYKTEMEPIILQHKNSNKGKELKKLFEKVTPGMKKLSLSVQPTKTFILTQMHSGSLDLSKNVTTNKQETSPVENPIIMAKSIGTNSKEENGKQLDNIVLENKQSKSISSFIKPKETKNCTKANSTKLLSIANPPLKTKESDKPKLNNTTNTINILSKPLTVDNENFNTVQQPIGELNTTNPKLVDKRLKKIARRGQTLHKRKTMRILLPTKSSEMFQQSNNVTKNIQINSSKSECSSALETTKTMNHQKEITSDGNSKVSAPVKKEAKKVSLHKRKTMRILLPTNSNDMFQQSNNVANNIQISISKSECSSALETTQTMNHTKEITSDGNSEVSAPVKKEAKKVSFNVKKTWYDNKKLLKLKKRVHLKAKRIEKSKDINATSLVTKDIISQEHKAKYNQEIIPDKEVNEEILNKSQHNVLSEKSLKNIPSILPKSRKEFLPVGETENVSSTSSLPNLANKKLQITEKYTQKPKSFNYSHRRRTEILIKK